MTKTTLTLLLTCSANRVNTFTLFLEYFEIYLTHTHTHAIPHKHTQLCQLYTRFCRIFKRLGWFSTMVIVACLFILCLHYMHKHTDLTTHIILVHVCVLELPLNKWICFGKLLFCYLVSNWENNGSFNSSLKLLTFKYEFLNVWNTFSF